MDGGGNCPPHGPFMDRETWGMGEVLAGRKRHHSGFCLVTGSYNLSSASRKPLTPEFPFRQVEGGWCSCRRPIAIRYGMAPFEIDNGSAGYAGMTTMKPHEDGPYSASENTTKNSPRKQRRDRDARNRILWEQKHM